MHHNDFTTTTEQKFHKEFRWNFFGSIFYECIKIIHQVGLMCYLSSSLYGLIGSTFSMIYFSTKIADSGATYTLPPFFNTLIKNRKNFTTLLFNYFLGPQIPIVIITSYITLYLFKQWFNPSFNVIPYLIIIPVLVVLETLRAFLRYLLHFSFKSKLVVCCELFTFTLYVLGIWTGFFSGIWHLSLNLMLLAHLIESTCIVVLFVAFSYQLYRRLDAHESLTIPPKTPQRFLHARIFNYFLRLSRELFSSNFITPLFALKFGLQTTGIFYFVGALMSSLQSIVKVSIGYSGNALLANVKDESGFAKTRAFMLLSEKTIKIIIPIVILLTIYGEKLMRFYPVETNIFSVFLLGSIFLIIFISEFFVILYDQFYIVEEASQNLFFIKIAEYLFYYLFVISNNNLSMIELLIRITIIRIASLGLMAYNAHYTWQIKPSFKTKKSYLISCLLAGIVIFFIVSRYFDSVFHLSQKLL